VEAGIGPMNMIRFTFHSGEALRRDQLWRLAVIAAGTLILCSCRSGLQESGLQDSGPQKPWPKTAVPSAADGSANVTPTRSAARHVDHGRRKQSSAVVYPTAPWPVMPVAYVPVAGEGEQQARPPHVPAPRRSPGYLPRPKGGHGRPDEYLRDGGDRLGDAHIGEDWSVRGLHLEDTVAHYDTLDGERKVVPSNRVKIYAPRFAAVRKVYTMRQNLQLVGMERIDSNRGPNTYARAHFPDGVTRYDQAKGYVDIDGASNFRERTPAHEGVAQKQPASHFGLLSPYEDFQFIRSGELIGAEKPRLLRYSQAARTWVSDVGLQVTIDGRKAVEDVSDRRPQQVYETHSVGKDCLRILKVASKEEAKPGEIVEFTLRFDNTGAKRIGNVTIIDNLTTRLVYVEGSQECTLEHNFLTQPNEGESLVLRWEIIDPLEPGEGGVIRFKCRVR